MPEARRLPDGWSEWTLGDLCRIEIGGTPSRNVPTYWDDNGSGFPWVSIADLQSKFLFSTAERITRAGVRGSSVKLVPAGTPLMSFKLTLGRTALAGVDLFTNEAIAAFYPAEGVDLSRAWLYHVLPEVALRGFAEQAVKGQTLNKAKLQRLPILMPPLPEQRRIAEVLDTADEAIAQTEALIAKLKEMKQGLLHDLLTRGLDENGQLRDPVAHPDEFKESVLGRIPRAWFIRKMTDVAADEPGSTTIGPFGSNLVADDYRSEGVPVVFVRDVRANRFEWNSLVYVEPGKAGQLAAHRVRAGDVLITKMGLPPCVACVYPAWMQDGVITADIIRLRPNLSVLLAEWLAHVINAAVVVRQVRAITGGVTRPKVTLADFRTLAVPVPSLGEQRGIVSVFATHARRIRAEESYRDKLHLLKQGLMQDLLTGRVRVPLADNEPLPTETGA